MKSPWRDELARRYPLISRSIPPWMLSQTGARILRTVVLSGAYAIAMHFGGYSSILFTLLVPAVVFFECTIVINSFRSHEVKMSFLLTEALIDSCIVASLVLALMNLSFHANLFAISKHWQIGVLAGFFYPIIFAICIALGYRLLTQYPTSRYMYQTAPAQVFFTPSGDPVAVVPDRNVLSSHELRSMSVDSLLQRPRLQQHSSNSSTHVESLDDIPLGSPKYETQYSSLALGPYDSVNLERL